MNLFEANIDQKTETILQNNKLKLRSAANIDDFNGDSFYGDLSKLPTNGAEFVKKLADEYRKLDEYQNKIIYIVVSENNHLRADGFLQYIKNSFRTMKRVFDGATFIFINNNTKKNFALSVDKYDPSQYNTLKGLYDQLITSATPKYAVGSAIKKTPEKQVVDKKAAQKKKAEQNKEKLVKAVASATENIEAASDDGNLATDEIIDKIDTDEDIVAILAQVEEDEKPRINKARAARMTAVNKKFLDSTVGKTTVKSLLYDAKSTIEPVKNLKVASVNKEEWDELKFPNFEKTYDINHDIYAMLESLSDENKTYPVAIRKVTVEDTSTSMDYILTYKAECEDSFGKRFTLKFDIPKFINNRFMMLRGNEKSMSGQLMLLPCLKTDSDTVQLVSNYNKIFIRRYGMANKSYPGSDKLIKTCNKYKGKKIKISFGDNSLICSKYDLPVDYIDLASTFNTIETSERIYYFDQDVYFKKYNADLSAGIPYAVDKKTSQVIYYAEDAPQMLSVTIGLELCPVDDEFKDIYTTTKPAERLNYSQASVLANKIPLIVILGYHEGLTNILKRAKIEFNFGKNLRAEKDQSSIRFQDGNLVFRTTYESSMLLNGLSECDTENYTFAEMDRRSTYLEFLDEFGGRILSDGLENFKDLFMDPITEEVCKDCRIPSDYIDLLIYANNLLADNKYNRHTDISGNRYRTNEIVAAYFYIALGKSYEQYANGIRRGTKNPMTMKQTAVIDMILTSNISSDLSTLNPLLELTTASTATFKGPSGMNSDRAYSLDKRTYDDSMINKLALSTGFSANVGIDRLTTIDMDIDGTRGYIKDSGEDDMSVTKTFAMTEAITPFGVTRETF